MPTDAKKYDPTEGMSELELLLAGVGRGMHHTGLGVGQMLGMVSRQDVEDARSLDGPLLDRLSGRIGSVVGMSSLLAPAAMIPGANSLLGAGLVGATGGLLQPSTSNEETLRNIAAAGLMGPTSIGLGRGLAEAKGLLSPQVMQIAR